jgi:hypothetical protein
MKNQIVSGIRGFSRGLVFVALAASLVLGACEGIIPPEVEIEDLASYTVPDANGRVRVSVRLPDDAARSFTAAQAQNAANYYEVIFKDRDAMLGIDTEYYRDSKPKGESLNVRLPLGHHFDILLLAGYQAKRVLLGSAYVNNKTIDGVAEYSSTGRGYLIETGIANIINLAITPIIVDPQVDFAVTYNGGTIDIKRNDDAFALDTAATALDAAATALADADTGLAAIKTLFVGASIVSEFDNIKTKTDADLVAPITDVDTMKAEFAAAKLIFDSKISAATTSVNMAPVTAAITALSPTPTVPLVNTAISALTTAITSFRNADREICAVITAANDALPLAVVLSTKASSEGTANAGGIATSVSNITGHLDTMNGPATNTGSLLYAVTQAQIAVSKTSEGTRSATGNLVMAIPRARDATAADFVVTVTNTHLLPLFHASGNSPSTLFSTSLLTLDYSGQGQNFIGTSITAPVPTWTNGTTLTTVYTINKIDMPDEDVYGVLSFNTVYYPFSNREAGSVWNIRNGVDNTKIDFDGSDTTLPGAGTTPTGSDRVGGGIFVTIGQGGDPYEVDIPVVAQP